MGTVLLSPGYDLQTNVLEWVQYPEDTTDTRTEYTYDEMYRIATAAATTDTGLNMSVSYTYNNDLLTKIQTPSTTYRFTYRNFGLRSSVKAGDHTLAQYSYTNDGNFYLDSLDYGNGDSVNYIYDDKGRVTEQTYEDGDYVTYQYDNNGSLAVTYDSAADMTTHYYYDFLGRAVKYTETALGYSHSVEYVYDSVNNLTTQVEIINGVTHTTSYSYDEHNRLASKTTDGITVVYAYDDFGRVTTQTTKNGDTVVLTESYTYTANSSQVSTYSTTAGNSTMEYAYTYDDNGNILSVDDGTNITSYVYDTQNQLIRENNQAGGFTHTWTYSNAGNIKGRKEYAYTTETVGTVTDSISYGYGDKRGWLDLLTAYDGKTNVYDEIGNPTTYRGKTLTWEHGRQLASIRDGAQLTTFTYDSNGMRTGRTYNNIKYKYIYSGTQLLRMEYVKNGVTYYLDFTYDAQGVPLTVKLNNTLFYYVTNLQGDVVGILNGSGSIIATYAYDAWGNCTMSGASLIVTLNPLRYRGYVYDTETGLYYLQSRYYDPEVGRFINADGYVSTGQELLGYNMFAYCGNNPVNRTDLKGNSWTIVGLIALCVVVALCCTASQSEVPGYRRQAQEKYNKSNVMVYEQDEPPEESGAINAMIYHPSDKISNINIDRSLAVTSSYEQDAILDVIIESPYYSKEVYGSKSFMRAQWVAHNASHYIASSGPTGFWIMQQLSGVEDPIESSNTLDLRSMNNFRKRQKALYTVISWFY